MKKIYFLEGLPGVGKSTITNYIANLNKKNIHTVNEIIVDIEDKTPIEQDLFIMNDNLKINKYDEGIIIIDRGPISTLTYNIVRDELVENFSSKQVIDWFNGKKIKWTSLGMNMVHSSDNSCEACCNFQSNFLESQLMTRFMYPNPKLIF